MRFLILILITISCSGYRYTQQDNPLTQYGINSLSIPMFHNYSNQPNVSGRFTRETYRLLTGFSGLKLSSGFNPNADALLIGIIKSPEKVSETLNAGSPRVAQDRSSKALESARPGVTRPKFSIPGTTEALLFVQVIVIKKPTEEELALLKSGIGDVVKLTSRVIFNETLPIRAQYTREIFDNNDVTDAISVTATQNEGVRRKTLDAMAEQTALNIRDMILYAF